VLCYTEGVAGVCELSASVLVCCLGLLACLLDCMHFCAQLLFTAVEPGLERAFLSKHENHRNPMILREAIS
jgi:hypothetical protein